MTVTILGVKQTVNCLDGKCPNRSCWNLRGWPMLPKSVKQRNDNQLICSTKVYRGCPLTVVKSIG